MELVPQWTPLAQLLLPLGLPKAPQAVRWSCMQVTLPQWVVLLPFEVDLVLRWVVTSWWQEDQAHQAEQFVSARPTARLPARCRFARGQVH